MNKECGILIIEDEVLSAMSLQQDLKRSGYGNCSYVTSGEKALENMTKNKSDLVITDVTLAGTLTGIETAGKLIEKYKIPVIIYSGYDYSDMAEKIESLEGAHFLKKPLRKTEILSLIARLP